MTRCYIFDIDGTLADITHRLHYIEKTPKDWNNFFADCESDKPIEHMVRLCRALLDQTSIVFVSGRSDQVRQETERWLASHDLYGSVYMRTAGDYKPDDLLKIELLAAMRADGWEPIMAFDDRNRVVKAWRDAGIPCAQVVDGDY